MKEADLRHFPVALKDFLEDKFWDYKVLREAGFSHQSLEALATDCVLLVTVVAARKQLTTLCKNDYD